VLTLSGIYNTGNGMIDGSSIYVSLPTARTLFALPQGVTRIEIKLNDLNAADATALRIGALTGLDAVPWTDGAEQLDGGAERAGADRVFPQGLCADHHRDRGGLGAACLSTYRRRPEIGIMRAMGAGRGSWSSSL
jgi:lipoprotein-releasing system permease protein